MDSSSPTYFFDNQSTKAVCNENYWPSGLQKESAMLSWSYLFDWKPHISLPYSCSSVQKRYGIVFDRRFDITVSQAPVVAIREDPGSRNSSRQPVTKPHSGRLLRLE